MNSIAGPRVRIFDITSLNGRHQIATNRVHAMVVTPVIDLVGVSEPSLLGLPNQTIEGSVIRLKICLRAWLAIARTMTDNRRDHLTIKRRSGARRRETKSLDWRTRCFGP